MKGRGSLVQRKSNTKKDEFEDEMKNIGEWDYSTAFQEALEGGRMFIISWWRGG